MEMRMDLDAAWDQDDCATYRLRWGGDEFTNEALWQALLAALDEASCDDEFWRLGDGFISESIRIRPELDNRLKEIESTDSLMQRIIPLVETRSYGPTMAWRISPQEGAAST